MQKGRQPKPTPLDFFDRFTAGARFGERDMRAFTVELWTEQRSLWKLTRSSCANRLKFHRCTIIKHAHFAVRRT